MMFRLSSTNVFKLLFVGVISVTKGQIKSVTGASICSNETFYSRAYKMCVPCSACDEYSTMFTSCTETRDTVCVKCADTSQEDLAEHPACLHCPACQPGEYMETACTSNTSTVCRPCPVGSFNTLASYRTYCTPCTSCENQIMIRDCNSSMDTECGSCQKGYFRDPHRNRCNRCLKCYPGQVPIKECENGQSGKRCSEYIITRTEYIDVPLTATVDPATTLTSMLTSTQNMSTFSSTDKVSNYLSSYSSFDITIILLVIVLTLILCALIILLKYKLKLLTKTSNLLDDNDDNSAMYIDDNFSNTDEIQFLQNLAESTFTNDFENQQCLTDETESPELIKTPSDRNCNFGNAYNYNFTNDNDSSKSGRQSQLYLSTNAAEIYRIHGVSRHESGQNCR